MPSRKYLITLADGREIEAEAPDTISPDAVRADAELNYPGVKDFKVLGRSFGGEALSLGQDALRGFVKGGAFMKDLALLGRSPQEMLANADARDAGQEPPEKTWFPQTAKTGAALEQALPTPQGDSKGRQYGRAFVEGLGGAAVGGGGKTVPQLLLNLGIGGTASTAAKGAEEVGAGPAGTFSAVGAVALLGALASRKLNPNEARLAAKMFENVDPANLQNAIIKMREMQAAGTPINLSQAMRGPSNIDDMVEFLANTPVGDTTAKLLKEQPGRVRLEADIIARGLPGARIDPQDSANLVQEAATGRLKQVRDAANAAYKAEASLAPPVAVPAIEAFKARVKAFKDAHPNIDAAQGMADDLLDAMEIKGEVAKAAPLGKGLISGKIQTSPRITPPAYLTDPNQLKEAVDSVLQGFGKNFRTTGATAKDANRYAQELRKAWKETIRASNPGLERAAAAARQIHEDIGNPLSKSVVGRLAGRGADETMEAPAGRWNSLMRSGSASDIEILGKELPKVSGGAETLRDSLTSDIATRLQKALPPGDARVPQDLAKRIRSSLAENPESLNQLRAKLTVIEDASNLPPGQLQEGFDKFFRYLTAAEVRPGKVSGLPAREIVEEGGRSATADVLQLQALWRLGRELRVRIAKDAYGTIDRLINSPEGVEMLRVIATRPPNHPGTSAAVAAFLGEAGSRPSMPTESGN